LRAFFSPVIFLKSVV